MRSHPRPARPLPDADSTPTSDALRLDIIAATNGWIPAGRARPRGAAYTHPDGRQIDINYSSGGFEAARLTAPGQPPVLLDVIHELIDVITGRQPS